MPTKAPRKLSFEIISSCFVTIESDNVDEARGIAKGAFNASFRNFQIVSVRQRDPPKPKQVPMNIPKAQAIKK